MLLIVRYTKLKSHSPPVSLLSTSWCCGVMAAVEKDSYKQNS